MKPHHYVLFIILKLKTPRGNCIKLNFCIMNRSRNYFQIEVQEALKCLVILYQHCRMNQQFAEVSKPLF
jgi:hypothetical protein